jgi:hypothetical protein
MPSPGGYKTVQARILAYAQEIDWTFVPRDAAERRRGFDPTGATPEDRARKSSLFFGDLLHAQVRAPTQLAFAQYWSCRQQNEDQRIQVNRSIDYGPLHQYRTRPISTCTKSDFG